jgi:hypothetical protein
MARPGCAKIYRGEKGKNAFDGMLALWNSPLGSSETVQIAEPLAYIAEERVMIQGPIYEETTLKRFMTAAFRAGTPEAVEELNQVMQKTAAGLAELHQTNVALGETWDWEDEMSEVRERVERLPTSYPGLVQAAAPLLNRIQQLADACPPDPGSSPAPSGLRRCCCTEIKSGLSILTPSASLSLPMIWRCF